VKIDEGVVVEGQPKNKNRRHQPTIKFTGFLPIKFLPAEAPSKLVGTHEFEGIPII